MPSPKGINKNLCEITSLFSWKMFRYHYAEDFWKFETKHCVTKTHVWTDRHKIPGHVWTDRHKNPGHLGHRDTENADKNVNSSKKKKKKKEESRILSRLEWEATKKCWPRSSTHLKEAHIINVDFTDNIFSLNIHIT